MKTINIFFLLSASAMLILNSCDNEETVSKPEITLIELGYENTKTAMQGMDLHIEAEVIAEGKIKTIQVIVHPEGEHLKKGSMGSFVFDEWEFDSVYTEFSGLKNTTFHKHASVPVTAEIGHYHFDFIVTDMEGNQSSVDDEVEILISSSTDMK